MITKFNLAIFLAMICVAATGCQNESVIQWQYKCFDTDGFGSFDGFLLTRAFNELGKEGWELATNKNPSLWCFKRHAVQKKNKTMDKNQVKTFIIQCVEKISAEISAQAKIMQTEPNKYDGTTNKIIDLCTFLVAIEIL